MKFMTLKVDKKGRVVLPKEFREELGSQDAVVAQEKEGVLELRGFKTPKDPLAFLTSLNFKTKKMPLQMKKQAQKAMMEAV